MYFVLYQDYAIGPFTSREKAYSYMAAQEIPAKDYAVKTDTVMQQKYIHLAVRKP